MSKIDELLKNEKVEWKKLGEVCEILDFKRKPITKSKRISGNYPYYGANGIQDYVNDFIFNGTFILMGEDGSVINKNNTPVLHWVEDSKIWVNNHAHVLGELDSKCILKYIYYFLTTVDISSVVKGTPPKINQESVKSIKIPIPSIKTQEKIVKTLDKFTNYVTELQAELQAELQVRSKQYEYYRDLLLSEEYLNKLAEKLDNLTGEYELKTVSIEEIVKIRNGKDWKTLEEGDIPVYGSGGKMNVSVNKYSYNRPTVLIPRKGSIGNVFYVDEPFWNVDTIFYTEIDDKKVVPKYFYYFVENYDIAKLSTESTRPSLTQSVLNKVKIDLPPIKIQNKIVEILDKFQSLLADTKGLLPQEIEQRQKQYEYYREKLLTFDTESETIFRQTDRQTDR